MKRPGFGLVLVVASAFAAAAILADDARPRSGPAFLCAGYLPYYRTKGFSAGRMQGVTDLIYFGLRPTDDGRFDPQRLDEAALELLRTLKQATGCRVLICLGGGEQSQGFPSLAADAAKRQTFVRELCAFCRKNKFDGVDYDWEHPAGEAELAAYGDLLLETKRGLGKGGLVTVAQSPWRDFGRRIYDIVDRVHVMSYNHKFPHAQLQSSQDDVARMLNWGCPREKLLLGVPFYGRNAGGKTKTYADLARNGNAAGGDLVQGYALNGRATIRRKVRYARESTLGGIMIWELGQDAGDSKLSLLEVIRREVAAP